MRPVACEHSDRQAQTENREHIFWLPSTYDQGAIQLHGDVMSKMYGQM